MSTNETVQKIIKESTADSPASLFSKKFYDALEKVGGKEFIEMFNSMKESEAGIKKTELKHPELITDDKRLEVEIKTIYFRILDLMARDVFKKAILARLDSLIKEQKKNVTNISELETLYQESIKKMSLGEGIAEKIINLRQEKNTVEPAMAYKQAFEQIAVLEFTAKIFQAMQEIKE